MPMFAENFVDEVKDRIDLYDLISPYVQLKKSGSKWVGLSPFNQEKTPSFMLIQIKAFFTALVQEKKVTLFHSFKKLKILHSLKLLNL